MAGSDPRSSNVQDFAAPAVMRENATLAWPLVATARGNSPWQPAVHNRSVMDREGRQNAQGQLLGVALPSGLLVN
jgi:hypothetical protein